MQFKHNKKPVGLVVVRKQKTTLLKGTKQFSKENLLIPAEPERGSRNNAHSFPKSHSTSL